LSEDEWADLRSICGQVRKKDDDQTEGDAFDDTDNQAQDNALDGGN
jgi:hypothetical protein